MIASEGDKYPSRSAEENRAGQACRNAARTKAAIAAPSIAGPYGTDVLRPARCVTSRPTIRGRFANGARTTAAATANQPDQPRYRPRTAPSFTSPNPSCDRGTSATTRYTRPQANAA